MSSDSPVRHQPPYFMAGRRMESRAASAIHTGEVLFSLLRPFRARSFAALSMGVAHGYLCYGLSGHRLRRMRIAQGETSSGYSNGVTRSCVARVLASSRVRSLTSFEMTSVVVGIVGGCAAEAEPPLKRSMLKTHLPDITILRFFCRACWTAGVALMWAWNGSMGSENYCLGRRESPYIPPPPFKEGEAIDTGYACCTCVAPGGC